MLSEAKHLDYWLPLWNKGDRAVKNIEILRSAQNDKDCWQGLSAAATD